MNSNNNLGTLQCSNKKGYKLMYKWWYSSHRLLAAKVCLFLYNINTFLQQSTSYRRSFVQENVALSQIIYSVNEIKIPLTMSNTNVIQNVVFGYNLQYIHNLVLFIIKKGVMTTK